MNVGTSLIPDELIPDRWTQLDLSRKPSNKRRYQHLVFETLRPKRAISLVSMSNGPGAFSSKQTHLSLFNSSTNSTCSTSKTRTYSPPPKLGAGCWEQVLNETSATPRILGNRIVHTISPLTCSRVCVWQIRVPALVFILRTLRIRNT